MKLIRDEEAYAELNQLDDKNMSLIMRKASDNGREALRILHDHYTGNGKLRIISFVYKINVIEKRNQMKM